MVTVQHSRCDFLSWLAGASVSVCAAIFAITAFVQIDRYEDQQLRAVELETQAATLEEFQAFQSEQDGFREVALVSVEDLVDFDMSTLDSVQKVAASHKCLAQAIYYESAFEPVIGQMAVADVVLNRARSSVYPNSICGVVFQGSHLPTGCQFSFTCDGSMQRAVSRKHMAAAEKLAAAVLAGVHMPVTLSATHYHADYVNPYWAPSLTRTAQIGTHKFYRFPTKRASVGSAAQ